jgi:transcriptional regulator with GAF, ATPase, and Fis domain
VKRRDLSNGGVMGIDEMSFFREATLRVCGSLEIEKALWECLRYIREFVPASQLSLHIIDSEQNVLETVAHSDSSGGTAMSLRTRFPEGLRQTWEQRWRENTKLFTRMGDDELARVVAARFGASDLSGLRVKLALEGKEVGVLTVASDGKRELNEEHARLLALLNEPFSIALSNFLRYRELKNLKDRLADDNRYLHRELRQISGEEIIGADFGLKGVMEMVRQVAPLESPVLLLGETGVGKELIAGAVHNLSKRKEGPLIKVNCGAIPETLMDSELFGHEKGAFTGAIGQKRGRFERAHGGTIFLDEIGELSLGAQVRLLRVLQEKEIERVGGTESIPVDIRVIAATHRDLEAMMEEGRFREDLYFRLRVFPIAIPPLRERKEDIPTLVQHVIQKKTREMKLATVPSLSPGALGRLIAYRWSGNVREMENAVERALILSRTGMPLRFEDLEDPAQRDAVRSVEDTAEGALSLEAAMARHIRKAMAIAEGKVEGKGGAAELLGVNPRTLRNRMKRLGIPFGRKAQVKESAAR